MSTGYTLFKAERLKEFDNTELQDTILVNGKAIEEVFLLVQGRPIVCKSDRSECKLLTSEPVKTGEVWYYLDEENQVIQVVEDDSTE